MNKINVKKGLYASLIASLLVSTTTIAAIPAMELVKAEPIKQESLKSAATISLTESFRTTTVETNSKSSIEESLLTKHKKQVKMNQSATLVQTSIIAD